MVEPLVTSIDRLRLLRHELRTPINHIIGYSEMLRDDAAERGFLALVAELDSICELARTLLDAINDGLTQSNIDGLTQSNIEATPDPLAAINRAVELPISRLYRHAIALHETAAAAGALHMTPDIIKIAGAVERLIILLDGDTTDPLAGAPPSSEDQIDPDGDFEVGTARGRLLVADDNALNRDMLSRRLRRLGYTVEVVEDGRAALDALDRAPFDLLLLDVMMPEMDGYQVLTALRERGALPNLPVIVLSALDEFESVARSIELGAQDYLPKPFNPTVLKARIGASLERKAMHDQEQALIERITAEKQRTDALLNVVIPIGVALSAEKHYPRLLERVVSEAMKLCGCDGGTLYLRADDDTLSFVIVRTTSLGIALGGETGEPITFASLAMRDERGAPNDRYVVTHTAITARSYCTADAYNDQSFDFSGTRAFDARTGYRTRSVLTVPLRDEIGRVNGVLQLINAIDQRTGEVIDFADSMLPMIESLSMLAAAALSGYDREQRLMRQIEDLRIEIDEAKRGQQVRQITENDHFRDIRARAQTMRAARTHELAASGEPQPASDPLRFYEVNGQQIHVHESGNPRGQLALLIHGWSSSWYAMSPLLDSLKRYRCVAVDLPGYGDSPRLPARVTIDAYVDLIVALMRKLTDRPALLIGHSMGGMIATTIAGRSPELIERMVLLCPTITGRLSTQINLSILPITTLERFEVAGRVIGALEPYLSGITDRLMRPVSFADRSGIAQQDYERIRFDVRRVGQGKVRAECYWAMRAHDLTDALDRVTTPTLVVWGLEDNTVPLRDASLIAEKWPRANLQVLPKAGHWPQFETRALTLRHLSNFIGMPLKLLNTQL